MNKSANITMPVPGVEYIVYDALLRIFDIGRHNYDSDTGEAYWHTRVGGRTTSVVMYWELPDISDRVRPKEELH